MFPKATLHHWHDDGKEGPTLPPQAWDCQHRVAGSCLSLGVPTHYWQHSYGIVLTLQPCPWEPPLMSEWATLPRPILPQWARCLLGRANPPAQPRGPGATHTVIDSCPSTGPPSHHCGEAGRCFPPPSPSVSSMTGIILYGLEWKPLYCLPRPPSYH